MSAVIEARPYQSAVLIGIDLAIAEGHSAVLAQMPTGGGKSVCFKLMAKKAVDEGKTVLIVVHRKELLQQAFKHMKSVGITPGIIQGKNRFMPEMRVQVASIQTLHKRLDLPLDPDLVIFDEAHHMIARTWTKVLNRFPRAAKIGFTATPCTTNGKGFEDLFSIMIRSSSVKTLMADGWLSGYKIFGANPIDVSEIKSQAGDFKLKELEEAADKPKLVADLVETWVKYAFGKKTITFCVSPTHSKHAVAEYNALGQRYWGRDIAVHLDGDMSDAERDRVNKAFALPFNPALPMFEGGGALILSNFGIVTEGYDVPDAECVQLARPTESLSLHLQMIGRVLRVAFGKAFAIILDHAGNIMRHGRPDADHEWTLEGVKKVEPLDIQCHHCGTIQVKTPERPLHCTECGKEIIPIHSAKESVPRGERSPLKHITEVQLVDLSMYSDTLMDFMVAISNAKEKYSRPDGNYPKSKAIKSLLAACKKNLIADNLKAKGTRNPSKVFDDLKQAAKILNFKSNWAVHEYQGLLQEVARSAPSEAKEICLTH